MTFLEKKRKEKADLESMNETLKPEPDYVERNRKAMKVWGEQHCRCPQCNSPSIGSTLLAGTFLEDGSYQDNVNRASCRNCDWSGRVSELVPKNNFPTMD